MTQAAYFNCHGEPLRLSAKDAVLAREPLAYAVARKVSLLGKRKPVTEWEILRTRADGKRRLYDRRVPFGCGINEEAAWRAALSAMRIADEEEAQ